MVLADYRGGAGAGKRRPFPGGIGGDTSGMLRRAFLLSAPAFGLAACAAAAPPEAAPPGPPPAPPPPATPASFDVGLYRAIARAPGNHFLSPFSAANAFALLCPGARGATAREMAAVFGFDADARAAAVRVHAAAQTLESSGEGALAIANACFVDRGVALDAGYRQVVRDVLAAVLESVDFQHAHEAARTHINAWVAQATHDRIQDLMGRGTVTPDTRLVLANAVYFKADWAQPFVASRTQDGVFHGARETPARLMRQILHARYLERDSVQIAELPYHQGAFALSVLLPRETTSLAAFEATLTQARLRALLDALGAAERPRLDLTLPKLRMEATYDLIPPLQALGLNAVFTGQSDLSGVTTAQPLAVSAVVQKTFLAIDEAGTEAAAATGIGVVATAAPRPEAPPIEFRADRPFFLVLHDRASGTILFLGRVETV